MTTASTVKVGDRIKLARDVERYPHFIARKGMLGTVNFVGDAAITAKMDEPLVGAEEWDNEIHWTDDSVEEFNGDVIVETPEPKPTEVR